MTAALLVLGVAPVCWLLLKHERRERQHDHHAATCPRCGFQKRKA